MNYLLFLSVNIIYNISVNNMTHIHTHTHTHIYIYTRCLYTHVSAVLPAFPAAVVLFSAAINIRVLTLV